MIGKNNPLNIRFSHRNHWLGLDENNPCTKGFCNFIDEKYCIRACAYLLMRTYRKRGLRTYSELINTYAPSSENDTDTYINFVCGFISVFPFDVPYCVYDFACMIQAMYKFESGDDFDGYILDIVSIINNFKLSVYESK